MWIQILLLYILFLLTLYSCSYWNGFCLLQIQIQVQIWLQKIRRILLFIYIFFLLILYSCSYRNKIKKCSITTTTTRNIQDIIAGNNIYRWIPLLLNLLVVKQLKLWPTLVLMVVAKQTILLSVIVCIVFSFNRIDRVCIHLLVVFVFLLLSPL